MPPLQHGLCRRVFHWPRPGLCIPPTGAEAGEDGAWPKTWVAGRKGRSVRRWLSDEDDEEEEDEAMMMRR